MTESLEGSIGKALVGLVIAAVAGGGGMAVEYGQSKATETGVSFAALSAATSAHVDTLNDRIEALEADKVAMLERITVHRREREQMLTTIEHQRALLDALRTE